ncbi:MAG: 2-C-methyl-D-erythritol 2,4-cyclodiphosphate synthase [Sphaerochaetaceae bacterium]|jgi:2-C-methyl-D-erythritol 2,4-cyclodiphosphate synthase|nr:2-C-methyl-D-erythritol 2,4-cyclodiphosphate synthase [Sphaerochaetaceae bacterium]MDY0371296.1 2-C-methyl-D-erythritol 2,4-cyclodiphosphate synthase [Sphaerochaetaceae bacterium]
MRIGTGWDIHPLVTERRLLLGGIEIPHTKGEEGHSDGDVLLHALIDALLGAIAAGDIGTHFPPTDAEWKDASSLDLLQRTLVKLGAYSIENIDCTVILQQPKLGPFITQIRQSIASACAIEIGRVSVKAKTAEGLLGELGRGEAVIAQVVVLITEPNSSEAGPLEEWV